MNIVLYTEPSKLYEVNHKVNEMNGEKVEWDEVAVSISGNVVTLSIDKSLVPELKPLKQYQFGIRVSSSQVSKNGVAYNTNKLKVVSASPVG